MNQDQVKVKLVTLQPEVAAFTLIFSGKASKQVNGLYHPAVKEIIIHNRNFTDDNALMYTAIHEFAHHVHRQNNKTVTNRAHTIEFRSIFHDLLKEAEAKGIYRNTVGMVDELQALATEIRQLYIKKNGELMKQFGQALIEAEKVCRKHNARFEDFIERALKIPKQTATTLMKITAMDLSEDLGFDAMKTVAGISNSQARSEVIEALLEGETVDQVKQQIAAKPALAPPDPKDALIREKKRIVKAIAALQARLTALTEQLEFDFGVIDHEAEEKQFASAESTGKA